MDRVARIVVVGGGECGVRAAVGLREAGFAGLITLVSAESDVGYERPPMSKGALLSGVSEPAWVVPSARLAGAGIDVRAGVQVDAIDRDRSSVVLSDGSEIGYDRALIATGARARLLDVPGGDHALPLRTIGDAERLHAALVPGTRVVVVGAGFIGLEVAAAARARGAEVTIVEAAPVALGRAVPPPIADVLVKRHAVEGVAIHFDTTVLAIDEGADELVVRAGCGDIACDAVVAGIGAIPNTELATAAGLEVDNGVAVDAQLRSSDPAILAAGDCCSFPHALFDGRRMRLESWRGAVDQSAVVVRNLLGAEAVYDAVPWFWSDQYDLGLQLAGVPGLAARTIVRERPDGWSVSFGLDADGRLVSACGVASGTSIARDIRVAELMIAAKVHPQPSRLADSAVALKTLLATEERSDR